MEVKKKELNEYISFLNGSIFSSTIEDLKSFDKYMKAAEKNDSAALFNLGLMHSQG